MKIAEVNVHVLEAKLSQPFHWSFNRTETRGACIVEIIAENGLTGWGECYGPARLNAAIVAAFRPYLIGVDPLNTELIWQTLYNQFRDTGQKGLSVTALSGVDIALWDLKGRILEQPVHTLMGGSIRTDVAAYATGTYRREHGDPLAYITEEVGGYVREGFGAVKLKIGFGVEEDLALVAAVRDAIGVRTRLMLDANHGFDALEAIRLGGRAERFDIDWFKEPVVPDDLNSYIEVRRRQPIPVAGGECEYTRWGFREELTRGAMDIIQPDTCATGGLSEAKKIADMAVAFGVRYVPHVWGTGIGLAAALNLLAVLPHSPPRYKAREPLLEFDRSEHPFRQEILRQKIEHVAGRVTIPDAPGLGIEINRAALEQFKVA